MNDEVTPLNETTPVLGLNKPLVGGDDDIWGGLLNANADTLDTAIGGLRQVPGGAIVGSAAPVANPGALWWDNVAGQLYVRYDDGNSQQWVAAAAPGFAAAAGGPFLPLSGGTVTGQTTFGASAFSQVNILNAAVPGRMLDFNKVGSAGSDTSQFSGNYIVNDTGGTFGAPRFVLDINANVQSSPLSGIWTGHFVTTSQRVGGNIGGNGDVSLDVQAIRSNASPIGKTTVATTLGSPNTTLSVANVANFATGYYPPGSGLPGGSFSMVSNAGIAYTTSSSTTSGNTLNMTSVNGLHVGMVVFGSANIPVNTTIQSIAGNAVTMSRNVTGTVSGGVNFMWSMMVKVGSNTYNLINTSAATGAGTLTFATPISVADGTSGNVVLSQQGGGPLWAAVLDLQDQTGLPSSASGVMLGIELDISGNDVDDGANVRLGGSLAQPYQGVRNFITFVASKYNVGGPDYQLSQGLVFAAGTAGVSMGRIIYPVVPFYVSAFDTRDATQMSGANAIWLGTNQTLALDTTAATKLSSNGTTVTASGGWTFPGTITGNGAIIAGWQGIQYTTAAPNNHNIALGWNGTPLWYVDGGAAQPLLMDNGALSQSLVMTASAGNPARITYSIAGGRSWWAGQWPDGGFYIADATSSANRVIINSVGAMTVNTTSIGFFNNTPIARPTGWGAPTGTATRTTFLTSSVTLPVLAEHVKALIDDLTAYGLIGP